MLYRWGIGGWHRRHHVKGVKIEKSAVTTDARSIRNIGSRISSIMSWWQMREEWIRISTQRRKRMQIEVDVTKNDCNYEQCRYFAYGKCHSRRARKDCLEIALAVLCLNEVIDGRNKCELQKGNKGNDTQP